MNETRAKILDTAERLFGEQGYAATSLRHIIAEAGVNLAAIHYHFGSKEDLLDQLVMRRAAPFNAERLELLDRVEAEPGPPAVEKVLEALLDPPFRRIKKHPEFVKCMGRLYGEGLMPAISEKHFHVILARFLVAFGRALPHLTKAELGLRLQFLGGAMAHTMLAHTTFVVKPAEGPVLLRELIAFLSGGLRAPSLRAENTKEK
jgi:AcrR family transcriptional regulator